MPQYSNICNEFVKYYTIAVESAKTNILLHKSSMANLGLLCLSPEAHDENLLALLAGWWGLEKYVFYHSEEFWHSINCKQQV